MGLENLGQSEQASRLTLNCQKSYVASCKSQVIPATILDLFDHRAFASEAKEEGTNYILRPGSLS